MYNHQVFDTTESFLEALHNGTLKRTPLPAQEETDFSWSTRKRTGVQRDLDHLPGPRSVSFAGLRFRVDHKQQYVSWMGWGVYLGFDRDMGLSLWDIRFRSERIIYEVCFFSLCSSLPILNVFLSLSHKMRWHSTVRIVSCSRAEHI